MNACFLVLFIYKNTCVFASGYNNGVACLISVKHGQENE